MYFTYPVTIPKNTPITNPLQNVTPLNVGTLTKVIVYFPWGCAALAGIRIFHFEHQVFPTNPDQWFTGNEIEITITCQYEIGEGPSQFHVEGYNIDDTFDHTPIIHFEVTRGMGMPSNLDFFIGA